MKTGAELIAEERARQISQEGWTPEHDDQHDNGEMVGAAAAYQLHALLGIFKESPPSMWPWSREDWKPSENAIRNLTKSGALLAAEIDRIQRLQSKINL
jgi:hypothetical protein